MDTHPGKGGLESRKRAGPRAQTSGPCLLRDFRNHWDLTGPPRSCPSSGFGESIKVRASFLSSFLAHITPCGHTNAPPENHRLFADVAIPRALTPLCLSGEGNPHSGHLSARGFQAQGQWALGMLTGHHRFLLPGLRPREPCGRAEKESRPTPRPAVHRHPRESAGPRLHAQRGPHTHGAAASGALTVQSHVPCEHGCRVHRGQQRTAQACDFCPRHAPSSVTTVRSAPSRLPMEHAAALTDVRHSGPRASSQQRAKADQVAGPSPAQRDPPHRLASTNGVPPQGSSQEPRRAGARD